MSVLLVLVWVWDWDWVWVWIGLVWFWGRALNYVALAGLGLKPTEIHLPLRT